MRTSGYIVVDRLKGNKPVRYTNGNLYLSNTKAEADNRALVFAEQARKPLRFYVRKAVLTWEK